MKKLFVKFRDGSCLEIETDRLVSSKNDENLILAYKGCNLVAAVEMDKAISLYLSEVHQHE